MSDPKAEQCAKFMSCLAALHAMVIAVQHGMTPELSITPQTLYPGGCVIVDFSTLKSVAYDNAPVC